jgi:hypothetical protein
VDAHGSGSAAVILPLFVRRTLAPDIFDTGAFPAMQQAAGDARMMRGRADSGLPARSGRMRDCFRQAVPHASLYICAGYPDVL